MHEHDPVALESSARKSAAIRFGAILAANAVMYFALLGAAFARASRWTVQYVDGSRISENIADHESTAYILVDNLATVLVPLAWIVAIVGIVAAILIYRKYRGAVGHAGREAGIVAIAV